MNTIDEPISCPAPAVRRFKFPTCPTEDRQSYIVLCILLWSALAYLFFSHFVMMAVEIKGASMSPTLLDGQRYILYRCPYLFRAPHQGEIVVIRVIAQPKDTIEIRRDGVYVNRAKLREPYLTAEAARASGNKLIKETVLGPNEFYVLGDNRDRSADSRIYGPVPRNFILGKINRQD
jgi:signal peptidase I